MRILGLHHISMKCSEIDYERVKGFYKDVLGLPVYKEWQTGALFDTGNGFIEIFHNDTALPKGTIRHFALQVESVDVCIQETRKLGYSVILEPKDVVLQDLEARVGFILGPIGEEIEFFQVK